MKTVIPIDVDVLQAARERAKKTDEYAREFVFAFGLVVLLFAGRQVDATFDEIASGRAEALDFLQFVVHGAFLCTIVAALWGLLERKAAYLQPLVSFTMVNAFVFGFLGVYFGLTTVCHWARVPDRDPLPGVAGMSVEELLATAAVFLLLAAGLLLVHRMAKRAAEFLAEEAKRTVVYVNLRGPEHNGSSTQLL
ncbi:hypothetical protein M3Y99_01130000 [Aphelenchoides fujianensis]|nr:hypothetical protein M3Y99_01130000 [Aphelenchoides fujianensis]